MGSGKSKLNGPQRSLSPGAAIRERSRQTVEAANPANNKAADNSPPPPPPPPPPFEAAVTPQPNIAANICRHNNFVAVDCRLDNPAVCCGGPECCTCDCCVVDFQGEELARNDQLILEEAGLIIAGKIPPGYHEQQGQSADLTPPQAISLCCLDAGDRVGRLQAAGLSEAAAGCFCYCSRASYRRFETSMQRQQQQKPAVPTSSSNSNNERPSRARVARVAHPGNGKPATSLPADPLHSDPGGLIHVNRQASAIVAAFDANVGDAVFEGGGGDFVRSRRRLPNRREPMRARSSPLASNHATRNSLDEKPLTLLESNVASGRSSLIESTATTDAQSVTEELRNVAVRARIASAASSRDEPKRQCQQQQHAHSKLPSSDASPSLLGQNNNSSSSRNKQAEQQRTNRTKKPNEDANHQGLIFHSSEAKGVEKVPSAKEEASPEASGNKLSDEGGERENSAATTVREEELCCGGDSDSCATSATCSKKEEPQQQSGCEKVKAGLEKQQQQQQQSSEYSYIDWNLITRKYRKMPRHPNRDKLCWQVQSSCFCRLILFGLQQCFPILTSFKNYNLPGDLVTDLVAGSTVAVLHIPQGMAYGLLAGVDPIHGLYVSFVPVLVMALMSKSRHVSYGTFAILSMMLANACDLAKTALSQQHALSVSSRGLGEEPALVLVDNHRSMSSSPALLASQERGFDLAGQMEGQPQQDWLISSALLDSAAPAASDAASAAASGGDGEQLPFVMPTNIEILTCICILVGLIQIIMSLLRLGILSLMFSDQLVSSFTAASAFHVITSQVPNLFDLSSPSVPGGLFKVCRTWWALTLRLYEGFNYYTAVLSLMSIIFLLLIKELIEPLIRKRLCKSLTCLPSELFLMSCIILSSWYWKFEQNFGIEIIGHVPTNLPAPKPPRLDLVPIVFQDALTIALVSFTMNLSLGQVYAKRNRYQLDPNQELFALGTSNVVGSFFSCYPCASSLSRSAVQSSLNVKSQVCALFSCTIVVLIICYFAPILHDLPKSTLSCIIIVALKGILFQVKDLYENWRLSKLDAIVWITTFTSVLAFGVTFGLVLGIAASLFMVFVRLLSPNHSILGQLPGTEIYVDRDAFMDCHEIDQVKIFRFNSALCYLNRTMFKACIEKSLPMIYKRKSLSSFYSPAKDSNLKDDDTNGIKFLVIDCSALAYCDYSGAETLVDIVEELEESKVQVYLAACPVKLIDMIEKMKRTKVLEHNVHPTITDALNHARYLRGRQMHQCPMTSCNANDCTCLHSVLNGLP